MQNGFGRQGVNFFQQQGGMNRFTPQANFAQNASRGAGANNGWQNNRSALRQQNPFQQQSDAGNGVQARLGPPRTPITAPGKTESPRPLLLRPGQEKAKPTENKNQASSVKKVDDPQEKPTTSGASGPVSNSKPPATAGTASAKTTPDDKKEPPSLMGNAPLMPDPPALSRRVGIHSAFASASPPQQQQKSAAAPPVKHPVEDTNQAAGGIKSEQTPNKFGQNPSGNGSRFNQNPSNPSSSFPKSDPVKTEEKTDSKPSSNMLGGNQGSSNQDRPFNQSNSNMRNQDGPNQGRFNNQGSRFNQNDRNPSQGGPASGKFGNSGDQSNDKSGENSSNANQNRPGQASGRFGNQGPNNPGQGGASNNRFGNQGSNPAGEGVSPNKSFGSHDDNQSRYGNQGNARFNQNPRDRSNDRGGSSNTNKSKSGPNSHGSSSQNDGRSGPANRDFRREPARGSRGGYPQEKLWDRVQEISGPQYDLDPLDMSEKKFNAQSRLFVGSLPRDITLEELKEMFSKYGELGQVYFNKDGAYAFINFDYHTNAEKAMREVNGTPLRGRPIKVRFAAITTGVRVKNLAPTVTNELLFKAFGVFGQVESSRVSVDDRGKPTGDGIIIFTEKKSAVLAYKKCQEESYFITSQLRPVIVEPWETRDDEEGFPEASIPKNELYKKDRKTGPRFAEPNSFESDYGKRWKQLFDIYKEKRLSLESDLKAEMDALEVKMQLVIHQQETEKLRKELAQREQEALQLQMGLNTFGETRGPSSQFPDPVTQLSASVDEYGGLGGGAGYGGMKRPIDYYDSQGMDPRAQGMDPRAQGMDPRAQGMDPRAQGMDPRAQGMDPRAQGMDPRAQGMDPRAQYDQSRSAYEEYYRGAAGGYDRGADMSGGYGRGAGGYGSGGYDRQAMDRSGEQRRTMDPAISASTDMQSTDIAAAAAAGGRDMYGSQAQDASAYDRKAAAVDPYGADPSAAATSVAQSADGPYNRPASASATHANPYESGNQQATSPYEASMKRSRY